MPDIELTDAQRQALVADQGKLIDTVRVRLNDLPTPAEVIEETERWCNRYELRGKQRREEVEEQFKLQYYFGGQATYLVDAPDGAIVIPITAQYQDRSGLRYVLLTPDERPHACLTVPPRWRDADSEILSSSLSEPGTLATEVLYS